MIARRMLAVVLGVACCIPFVEAAKAATAITSFTMRPQAVQVGEPVLLTDTTVNKTGLPFSHGWLIYGPNGLTMRLAAGDPGCLDAACSTVQLVPPYPGRYNIEEAVQNAATSAVGGDTHLLAVSDDDHPLPFQLVTPTTITLPAVIEVLTPSSNIDVTRCTAPALLESYWGFCNPYEISRSARDSNGLYRFKYGLPMGPTGTVEMVFSAGSRRELVPGSASDQEFAFEISSSAKQLAAVESCHKGEGSFSVTYYASFSSRVVAKLQVRKGKHWVTRKQAQASFTPDPEPVEVGFFEDPKPGRSPWFHRYLYFNFGQSITLGAKRRIVYEIKRGNKVLRRGRVSQRPCYKQREF